SDAGPDGGLAGPRLRLVTQLLSLVWAGAQELKQSVALQPKEVRLMFTATRLAQPLSLVWTGAQALYPNQYLTLQPQEGRLMFAATRLGICLLFALSLVTTSFAQDHSARSNQERAPSVTASASTAQLRLLSPDTVYQLRLEVFDTTGETR